MFDLNNAHRAPNDNPSLINKLDADGRAPLHYAAMHGQIKTVHDLLNAGAQIDLPSRSGKSALVYAAAANHPAIIKTLLSFGAKNRFAGWDWRKVLKVFEPIDNLTLWALTEKKTYEFNPHRHVKIWLSQDPQVFMNAKNQLRLVQMRGMCPGDEINLVYDSQLLSLDACQSLLHFCFLHDIKAVDIRTIMAQCTQELEQKLLQIYTEEISHLHEGGNLGAASDILRWLGPVYRLGTYSDLDVRVSTKGRPKTITVSADLLLNLGTYYYDGGGRERLSCNNDIIAVVNPDSEQIKKAQQLLIKACTTLSSRVPNAVGDLPRRFWGPWQQYNKDLTRLRAMYLGKTPRQWRANIPAFMQCLNELGQKISEKEHSIPIHAIDLVSLLTRDRSILERDLYMDSVIGSTGPGIVADLLETTMGFYTLSVDYALAAYSLAFYSPLSGVFSSTQAASLHMNPAVRTAMRGGDFSWAKDGYAKMALAEVALNSKAEAIQKVWKKHLGMQQGRLMRLKAQEPGEQHQQKSLMQAIARGDHQCLAYLLAQGVEVNGIPQASGEQPSPEENSHLPLDSAIKYGHPTVITLLLNAGARTNQIHNTIKGKTLSELIKSKDLARVQLLITLNRTLLNERDSEGYPPLHLALGYQRTDITEYLIAAGADLNAVTGSVEAYPNIKHPNKTALDLLMMHANDPLAIQLVKAGAKSSPVVTDTFHAIHLAARNGSLHHVQSLLTQEPELLDLVDCSNQTPLLWAASRGYHHIVAFLIARHADLNRATDRPDEHQHHYCSPLDWAARNGHIRTIILLLEAGAKANHPPVRIKNNVLVSAIKEADFSGIRHFIKYNKVLVNALDNDGYALLHYAALYGRVEIIQDLIATGANVDLRTAPVAAGSYEQVRHHQMTARELWCINHPRQNNPFNFYCRTQDLNNKISQINALITGHTPNPISSWYFNVAQEKTALMQLKKALNQAAFKPDDSPDKTADDLLTEITSAWAEEWQQESPPKRTRKQTFFSADTSAPKPTEQVLQAIKALLRPNMNTIPTESVSSAIDDLLSLPELSKP